EPRIDYLGGARHRAAALALPCVAIDERLVWVEFVGKRDARSFRQLGVPAHRFGMSVVVVAHPDRKWRSPVSIARNGPVDVVRQPLAEASSSHFGGMPVDA